MKKTASVFDLSGVPISVSPFGNGHLHVTYLVETENGKRYILQKINQDAFRNVPALMENILAITGHLAKKVSDPRECLHVIPTLDGKPYYQDPDGECWRVFDYIEDSLCLEKIRTREDFTQVAVAFGRFSGMLSDYPAETLHETIPDFHNTPVRFRKFHKAVQNDEYGRAKNVRDEIEFLLSHENEASVLQNMRETGALPVRVTHNDTKLNNVMLDKKTGKALCVIDLDTVMPGLAAYDFGDAIRFGASTGLEDEKDLNKVELDLNLYQSFAEGFIANFSDLTPDELTSLPLGAKLMTLENGVRFLTDYLEGDHYFSTAYPEHNLDRSRTQIKLVKDTEIKWNEILKMMETITA
ncbi:MAG: aminoglycoside phosphotransferase family protein [Lachnospiraceae bacterium]|nr:aminoglycoside phosphotransferase family protein [Lachnospiraceae bacterium]